MGQRRRGKVHLMVGLTTACRDPKAGGAGRTTPYPSDVTCLRCTRTVAMADAETLSHINRKKRVTPASLRLEHP